MALPASRSDEGSVAIDAHLPMYRRQTTAWLRVLRGKCDFEAVDVFTELIRSLEATALMQHALFGPTLQPSAASMEGNGSEDGGPTLADDVAQLRLLSQQLREEEPLAVAAAAQRGAASSHPAHPAGAADIVVPSSGVPRLPL